jgi:biopolymer transport protein ExbD
MKIPSPRATKRARIEIIPLIDIIFFLLATFMLVSISMIKNAGIPVNLPVASTAAAQERKDHVVLTVTEQNELFMDKERIELAQLGPKLAELKTRNPDPKIFINGDEKADFGHAVAVLDKVREFGITKIAIETKPKSAAN